MAGTIVFALLPLYLTAWRDAVYDGALLILAVAFSADAVFRCVDPANKKDNWTVFFAIGSMAVLALSLLQYGPIANDLRKEKAALQMSVLRSAIQPLVDFGNEREEDERSYAQQFDSIADFQHFGGVQRYNTRGDLGMEFSWEALAGVGVAVVMLAAAVYRRISTRNRETASGASKDYLYYNH